MRDLALLFHVAAAIFWMGGMAFLLLALRPALALRLEPPARLPLLADVLARFFVQVVASIVVLLLTGAVLMAGVRNAPAGSSAMAVVGVVMMLVFAHIWFAPYRRLKAAVAAAQWPQAGAAVAQITTLAKLNFALGWLAIAAVLLWR